MADHTNRGADVAFLLITAATIVAGIIGTVLWLRTGPARSAADTAEATGEAGPETDGSDLEAVAAVVEKGACAACHVIPDIPNPAGQIGPDLSNIGAEAAGRIEGYTAKEYLRESIVEPNAFIAPECPNDITPCPPAMVLTAELSRTELETLVDYLSTLGVDEGTGEASGTAE